MSVDILIPTINRIESLVMTLSGIAGQSVAPSSVIVSDQSDQPALDSPVIKSLVRIIEARGVRIRWQHRVPSLGIAEQRDFLLEQSNAGYVLFLDDDVFMSSWVLDALVKTLEGEGCGFVGAFPNGLSFKNDFRPEQQKIEYWEGRVVPECISPNTPEWQRRYLNRAANLWHVSQTLPPGTRRKYKIAWIASCVLYDRAKLLSVGGFSFWRELPRYHSGEEVLVQNLLMRRWGGCGIIPSGTFHSEVPSTVLNSHGGVDGHALELLKEKSTRYGKDSGI
jgi:GT2 family glycosyltransferase